VRPENSYRVLLAEDGTLQWLTENEGREVRFETDPESTAWQRFVTGFIKIMPVGNGAREVHQRHARVGVWCGRVRRGRQDRRRR
jgi:hypothetical protein